MKKALSVLMLLVLLLTLTGSALAEAAEGSVIECNIENGSYVIRVPAAEDDQGWDAFETEEGDAVVKAGEMKRENGALVVRFDPVGDGEATVGLRHFYCASACDQAHTWDLKVENGAVVDCTGGSYSAYHPEIDDVDMDDFLRGEWLEKGAQFTQMTIEKNEAMGWDVEIISPVTHGAYVFKATAYFDCFEDAFVYDKGKFFAVPITDTAETDLGEALVAGATGSLKFDVVGEDNTVVLQWFNSESPDEVITFIHSEKDLEPLNAIERFEGVWACDRATLEMYWEEEGFRVLIRWGSSAWEHTEWEYSCYYHEENDTVVSMPFGIRTDFVYGDNGELVSATEVYNDGEATFSLDAEGRLHWQDEKENAGEGMAFDKMPEEADEKYLVLVNKEHSLPEGWEAELETVHVTNSVGQDVEVEAKAYEAYLALAAEMEAAGIHLELDSAYRSVAEQQDIWDRFMVKYGEEYTHKFVAVPGYSEHHTGLALDLYFRIDGKDVYYNEDMTKPEYEWVWNAIHDKLAKHGFILRYLEGWEDMTGYGYEPWHIRYVGDPELAAGITALGITLEEYLGKEPETAPIIDYGASDAYLLWDLREAMTVIKKQFSANYEGCILYSLRYAGDEANNEENLRWLNELKEGKNYTECAEFLTDFYSAGNDVLEADLEYTDYQWWLARTEGGAWELVNWGY